MGSQVVEAAPIFRGDSDYLEEYVRISALLCERSDILGDAGRRYRMPRREREEREAALARLNEVNASILESEWYFCEKVAQSIAAGKRFIFEDVSIGYGFSHLEKRVALFFLCARISRSRVPALDKFGVAELFDIGRSIEGKMESLTLFAEGRALMTSEVIQRVRGFDETEFINGYRLNPKFLEYFCGKMGGSDECWDDARNKKCTKHVRDNVGFVKEPDYALEDVVLPEAEKERLGLFLTTFEDPSLKRLGIDKVVKKGKGLTFLFYGPPGTGKSMLAEAVAAAVGKDILVADASKIVNCFVGETEKGIARLFERARDEDLVILLDEADSLLYSRQQATNAHTVRFTNAMLTEIERFDGIAIFTSNMDGLLDEAMERRIALKIRFEVPTREERIAIWKKHIPSDAKLDGSVDFALLGSRYEFSGGYIKNAVVSALRKVAYRGSDTVTMDDLLFGAESEQEGMFNKRDERRVKGFGAG